MTSSDSPFCPLCDGGDALVLGVLQADALRRQWAQQHGVRIGKSVFDEIRLLECAQCRLKYFWPRWIGDEGLYEQLGRQAWYYMVEKEEYEIARPVLERAHKVLEIGAGRGALARKVRIPQYVGLELNTLAVREAQEAGLDVRNVEIGELAKHGDICFDCVCMFQLLEHVGDVKEFLGDCVNCLQRDGALIVGVPNDGSFVGAEANNVLNMPPHHATRWNEYALRWIGKQYALRVEGVYEERLADYHIRNYARCVSSAALARALGRTTRMLDGLATSVLWRGTAAILSMPMAIGLRHDPRLRPRGHSIVGVFRK